MIGKRSVGRNRAIGGLIVRSGRAAFPRSTPAQTAPNLNDGIRRFRSRFHSCGAAVAVCAAILPVAAAAQNSPTDRIDAIEQQIRKMQAELKDLKGQLGQVKCTPF
jgi:TolA-binding protein